MSDALNFLQNHPLTIGVGGGVITTGITRSEEKTQASWYVVDVIWQAAPWNEIGQIVGPSAAIVGLSTWLIMTVIPWTRNKAIPFIKKQYRKLKD